MNIKFLLIGAGFIASMGLLIAVGVSQSGDMHYYVSVGEFLDGDRNRPDLRVNGKVAQGTIQRLQEGQEVRFMMTDGDRELAVHYEGVVPDTFVDRADVVVQGNLDDSSGVFEAHELFAKCPSKYEAADGEEGAYGTNDGYGNPQAGATAPAAPGAASQTAGLSD